MSDYIVTLTLLTVIYATAFLAIGYIYNQRKKRKQREELERERAEREKRIKERYGITDE